MDLAEVWVSLGNTARAESLARSITHLDEQDAALTAVAAAVAVRDPGRAYSIASTVTDPSWRALAIAQLAAVEDRPEQAADLVKQAGEIARSIDNPDLQSTTLTQIAATLANSHPGAAENIVREAARPVVHDPVFSQIAKALAVRDPDRAEAIASAAVGMEWQAIGLAGVAAVVAKSDSKKAASLISRAESIARGINSRFGLEFTLAEMATEIAGVAPDRAEDLACEITDPSRLATALGAVAAKVASSGAGRGVSIAALADCVAMWIFDADERAAVSLRLAEVLANLDPGRSCSLLERAERAAERVWDQSNVLSDLAAVVVSTDPQRAEALADKIQDPYHQAKAFARLAAGTADADVSLALGFVAKAEKVARSVASYQREQELAKIASAIAVADPDWAETVAGSVASFDNRALALTRVAAVIAAADPNRAERLVMQADKLASFVADSDDRAMAVMDVAGEMAASDPERAVAFAFTLADNFWRARALARVAAVDSRRAVSLAARAEKIARSVPDPDRRAWALMDIAGAFAVRDLDRAVAVASSEDDPYWRALALSKVAEVAGASHPDRAAGLANRAVAVTHSIRYPDVREECLVEVLAALAASDRARADKYARSLDGHLQDRALSNVAISAASKDAAWAREVAGDILDRELRALTLAKMAVVVPAESVKGLLASALQVGMWQSCIMEVIRVDRLTASEIGIEYAYLAGLRPRVPQ
ncbi:hypothetical protein [Micromonospora rubida]|uniref:hypothetical protein n=1 Tax=Micromonospora rubida TaxID=2697657 RepID=UPI00137858DA|nr:hypothetical protein [Micromonospora rubida]NBE81214.1 hypothetical protein [Micromonospora rubida]